MKNTFYAIGNISDLDDGEMKQVTADGTDILLSKIDGKYFAVGAYCTHYGAPLAKGALCGKHVICPWHHAWFDVTNGNLLEPPAFDALPKYDIELKGDEIFVGLPAKRSDRCVPDMTACNHQADNRHFAILGGGAAGYAAAQTLREEGFVGKITMVSQEEKLPYDRTMLSKNFLEGKAKPKDVLLRSEDFFKKYDIDVLNESTATKVDHANKRIVFEKEKPLPYDVLLVATGGVPRKMDVPGAELNNIFVLRSFESADEIVNAVGKLKNVVVVGGSFIGMEAAASLTARGLAVTVVMPDDVPFAKTLGPEIGQYFKSVHQHHGVHFKLGTKVKAFEGKSKVDTVVLENGDRLEADVVITGIGVSPATEMLKDFKLEKDGGVATDKFLNIAPNVFAAGDIAAIPAATGNGRQRIEHWRYALQQGKTAALNMLGKKAPFTDVPFFWTAHFGISLRYLGHAKDWDEIFFDGEISKKKFLAFYLKDNRIDAVAGIGRDTEMAYLEQIMKDEKMPSASDLKKTGVTEFMESIS